MLENIPKNVTIFLAWRHGQTPANAKSLLSGGGSEDEMTDLTEEGRGQAKDLANIIHKNNVPLTKIFSSDLRRAQDTAQAVAEKQGIPVITNQQLREVLHGKWHMEHAEPRKKKIKEVFQREIELIKGAGKDALFDKYFFWNYHPFPFDGHKDLIEDKIINVAEYVARGEQRPETCTQLYKRVKNEIKEIGKDNLGQCVGLSVHGAFLNTIIDKFSSNSDEFLPPWYLSEDMVIDNNRKLRKATRTGNCGMVAIKYDHSTKKLSLLNLEELGMDLK